MKKNTEDRLQRIKIVKSNKTPERKQYWSWNINGWSKSQIRFLVHYVQSVISIETTIPSFLSRGIEFGYRSGLPVNDLYFRSFLY